MLDRFKDAQWYIGFFKPSTIYDASDLEGDGPNGHGMVCESATLEDARLIAASPDLLAAAKAALDRFSDPALEGMAGDLLQELEQAIAKAEGRVHQDPRLKFGPPLDTCIDCMEEEVSDHTNTRIQVGCGYIIVDREECQNMRHVEEGE